MLRELLGPKWELIPIVHDNSHEPCWLYSQLMDADMLVTPHGCVLSGGWRCCCVGFLRGCWDFVSKVN